MTSNSLSFRIRRLEQRAAASVPDSAFAEAAANLRAAGADLPEHPTFLEVVAAIEALSVAKRETAPEAPREPNRSLSFPSTEPRNRAHGPRKPGAGHSSSKRSDHAPADDANAETVAASDPRAEARMAAFYERERDVAEAIGSPFEPPQRRLPRNAVMKW